MKYFILISWWCISFGFSVENSQAQVLQTERFELPYSEQTTDFEVTSLEKDGLLLCRRITKPKTDSYEIIKLDTAYRQTWYRVIELEKNFTLAHKRYFQAKYYALFRGSSYYDFQLLVVDAAAQTYKQYEFRNYIPFSPTQFEVNNKGVIIGGYYSRVPIVVFFDLTTLRLKILPGLFNEAGELSQIKTYTDNTFDVLLCARYFNREKTIWIKSYTPEGDFINQLVLPVEESKNLLFGRVLKTENNLKVVAGVYGNRNSEYSKGFFIALVDPLAYPELKYYNFADLENFFGYMRDKREQRVKSRIERRKLSGKKNRFNYRLLVHELIPYQDQFIMLGEAFYPKYKTMDRSGYSGFFYGRSASDADRIFDGYRYTHATVLGFNANGQLLWDNSFEINDIKTFELEQFVKLKTDQGKITLLYAFDNQLRTKVISGREVVEGKNAEPIRTLLQNVASESDNTTINKLEYWYDDYLFAYGVQDVVNINQKGDQTRRSVFFINKLKCK